jgi:hypothetical protein
MISRRAILYTGGAAIVIGGAGLSAALLRDAPSVRQPWSEAAKGGFGDPRLNALAYAILAPNPHNRQPWWVTLDGSGALVLHCDLDRRLPETDPPDRQITIGLGAFLELLRFAAAEQGYRADTSLFPEGEPQPRLDRRAIARVAFVKEASVPKEPLLRYALARRTVRVPYDAKPVSPDTIQRVAAEAGIPVEAFGWTTEPAQLAALKQVCREGWRIEQHNTATHHESTKLTRIGAAEVAANPDGISLYGPMMEAYRLVGVLSRDQMERADSQAFAATLAFYNGLIDTARAFGWLTTPSNSRVDQIAAGASWLRINLAATKLGVAMHPLSQVLQEFPQMARCYEDFHRLVGVAEPARVQGLFRFGYAHVPQAAPRWPMVSRIANLNA